MPDFRFNVGDRVRRIANTGISPTGSLGVDDSMVIISRETHGPLARLYYRGTSELRGRVRWCFEEELELNDIPRFQIGDRVRKVLNLGSAREIGTEFTIVRYDNPTTLLPRVYWPSEEEGRGLGARENELELVRSEGGALYSVGDRLRKVSRGGGAMSTGTVFEVARMEFATGVSPARWLYWPVGGGAGAYEDEVALVIGDPEPTSVTHDQRIDVEIVRTTADGTTLSTWTSGVVRVVGDGVQLVVRRERGFDTDDWDEGDNEDYDF